MRMFLSAEKSDDLHTHKYHPIVGTHPFHGISRSKLHGYQEPMALCTTKLMKDIAHAASNT